MLEAYGGERHLEWYGCLLEGVWSCTTLYGMVRMSVGGVRSCTALYVMEWMSVGGLRSCMTTCGMVRMPVGGARRHTELYDTIRNCTDVRGDVQNYMEAEAEVRRGLEF